MVKRLGSRAEGGKKRKVGRGRVGGGSGSARGTSHARLRELLRGKSEEDQDTFKDGVSSVECDNPQVGIRVEDPAETPCLKNFQAGERFQDKERWKFLK